MAPVADNRRTSYERWMEQEGLPVLEAYWVEDVAQVSCAPWPRLGVRGAFIQLKGMEGITGMVVAEIPGKGAMNPEKHLYEEVVYILKGQGLTEVWQDKEEHKKQIFEWKEGSLFAFPLNNWHRLVNGSREPVFLMAVTNAPLVMDIYHNVDFVFQCDYRFRDRYEAQANYFNLGEKRHRIGLMDIWETNFIPNVMSVLLDAQEHKGAGGQLTQFEMAGNGLVGHIAEWPVGRYHKGHRHGAGAVVSILRSKGYTLMWPSEAGMQPYQNGREDAVIKADWKPGSILSPPRGWFHQHFNTGPEPARQLAIRYGSSYYFTGFHHKSVHQIEDGTLISVKKGGNLIEYEDEDPEIRRRYEAELAKQGRDG